ncbi:unnamed protein product [Brassica rapa subsp. trilocularis]
MLTFRLSPALVVQKIMNSWESCFSSLMKRIELSPHPFPSKKR